MRLRRCCLLALTLASPLAAQAPATPAMSAAPLPSPHFLTAGAFDFPRLVPAPPARDSVVTQGELVVLRQVQAARTAEQAEWAKLVDADTVFNHGPILGPWFRRENLPATEAFFKDLGDDLRVIDRAAKVPFQRPRPHVVDPAIQPCVRLPTSTSYPSGTALQAYVWAELLADIFPEKREELLARAERAAWSRVLGGVHYPSDLAAGRLLVPAFLAECRKNAAFNEGVERCRRELRAAAPADPR